MVVVPLWSIYTIEYNLAMRMNEVQLHTTKWMNCTHIRLREKIAMDELKGILWAKEVRLKGVYTA